MCLCGCCVSAVREYGWWWSWTGKPYHSSGPPWIPELELWDEGADKEQQDSDPFSIGSLKKWGHPVWVMSELTVIPSPFNFVSKQWILWQHTHTWYTLISLPFTDCIPLQCKDLLDLLGVPYLQSVGEAEALCGLLNKEGVRVSLTIPIRNSGSINFVLQS